MRRKYKKKRGPVNSKKITVDGITFASGLEKYMYQALKDAKIESQYEGKTFGVSEGFDFTNISIERCANGRGNLKIEGVKNTTYKIYSRLCS